MDDAPTMSPIEAFEEAHRRAGGNSALARICGCTPPNIAQLLERGSPMPAEYVLKTEAATGVARHLLRPDIYPVDLNPPPVSLPRNGSPASLSSLDDAGTSSDPLHGLVS